jgi:hypothetical protein
MSLILLRFVEEYFVWELQSQTGWSCSEGQLFIVGFLHFKNIEKKL